MVRRDSGICELEIQSFKSQAHLDRGRVDQDLRLGKDNRPAARNAIIFGSMRSILHGVAAGGYEEGYAGTAVEVPQCMLEVVLRESKDGLISC